jgi:Icc protein
MADTLLRFVHISDTHISTSPDYGLREHRHSTRTGAEALVRELKNLPFTPDLVLHTGDVAYDPDAKAYAAAKEILEQIPYPIYYVAGNHDHPEALQQVMLNHHEAHKPFYYTFEVKGVQFIVADSNGPAEPPRGYVDAEQLAWLTELCSAKDDRPLVVAVHHNALPVEVPWLDDYMRITNGEAFHQALLPARERLRGVFFGHVHQNLTMYRDGILYNSTLSSWNQFHAWPGQEPTVEDVDAEPGYSIVTLTRNQTYIRRCRFRV